MQPDVVEALQEMGYGTATVKWVERRIVMVAFTSEKQGSLALLIFFYNSTPSAKDALVLSKHPWLRLRSLINSNDAVHKAALEFKRSLDPPK